MFARLGFAEHFVFTCKTCCWLGQVQYLMKYSYETPEVAEVSAPKMFTMGVTEEENPTKKECWGCCKLLSPLEAFHALLLSMDQALQKNDAELMVRWKRYCLTVTCEVWMFKGRDIEDRMFYRAANAREQLGAQYEALYPSPQQRVCQLIEFRKKQELIANKPKSVKDLVTAWNKEVTVSSGDAVSVPMHASRISDFDLASQALPFHCDYPSCPDLAGSRLRW